MLHHATIVADENSSEPTNPLSGRGGLLVEFLRSLDDEDLLEYCGYWHWRWTWFRNQDEGFAEWKCSNHLSAGKREPTTWDQRDYGAAAEIGVADRGHSKPPNDIGLR